MRLLNSPHSFRDRILKLSGEDARKCTQCGKCTGGCPLSPEMDRQPNQILRLIQTNDPGEILASRTIWLCASCRTCSVRCPEGIEIAGIMEVLRKLSLEEGIAPAEGGIVRFNELFLDSIRKRGRVHETELMLRYNLALRRPFKDAHLGPRMLRRGKLGFRGEKVRGLDQVREIFHKSKRFLKG